MEKFKGAVAAFVRDEEAATAAEYGLMAALVAGALVVIVSALGTQLKGLFTNMNTQVGKASGAVGK